MRTITRANVTTLFSIDSWKAYKKKRLTTAIRISGPFEVLTREGVLTCPDGYLALDSQDWPYPIAKDEFETIYEEVTQNG